MGKLEGKVAVVTGASKGIGFGIAQTFASEGARVVLAARSADVMERADELRRAGFDAIGVRCDVSDYDSCRELAQAALDEYGAIDILDCNAGICHLNDFFTADDAWRDSHIDINIKGVWNACRAIVPAIMKASTASNADATGTGESDGGAQTTIPSGSGGSVIITSSVTGYMVADPGEVAYATSKAALVGFTKALAREVASRGVRVNCICPGYVRTPLVEGMAVESDPEDPERAIDAIAASVPLGRLGTPTECGQLCAFLASDESAYITGTQIVIDGGSTLPETSSMGQ